jgi:uncharacterized protein
MAKFVLHVKNIDEEGKDYAFELTPAWLDAALVDASSQADPAFPPGALRVHAQKNGSEYLVTGSIAAHLLTECGRCLAPAAIPVDVQFATLFSHGSSKPLPPELELSEEDLQREQFVGNEIMLDSLVREHLVLEVPMQPLCSPDCRGIPVPKSVRPPEEVFGGADDVDPRLAPLERLRDKVPPKPKPEPEKE